MNPAGPPEQYPQVWVLSRYLYSSRVANCPVYRLVPAYAMDLLLSIPLISTLMTPSWSTYMNILFFYTVVDPNPLLSRRTVNKRPRSGPPSSSPMTRPPSTPAPSWHSAPSSGWRRPSSSSPSTPCFQASHQASSSRGQRLYHGGPCASSAYPCSTCCS